MTFDYKPRGVCTRNIKIDLDGGVIRSVDFSGGCAGNLAGITKLVAGMRAEDIIEKFKGTPCGYKSTSCPDQLAKALELALKEADT